MPSGFRVSCKIAGLLLRNFLKLPCQISGFLLGCVFSSSYHNEEPLSLSICSYYGKLNPQVSELAFRNSNPRFLEGASCLQGFGGVRVRSSSECPPETSGVFSFVGLIG